MKIDKSVKLALFDLLTIFLIVFLYKIFILSGHNTISKFASLFCSFLINYFISNNYIFNQKNNLKKIIIFALNYVIVIVFILLIGLFCNYFNINDVKSVLQFLFFWCYLFSSGIVLFDTSDKKWYEKLENGILEVNELWKKFISLKIINIIFKILPQNLLVFLFFIGSVYYSYNFFVENDPIPFYQEKVLDSNIGPILPGNIYELNFNNIDVSNSVNKIGIMFADYFRKNTANLNIKLYYDNTVVLNENINMKKIKNMSYYYFNIPETDSNSITDYRMEVFSDDATSTNTVTIITNSESGSPAISLIKSSEIFSVKHIIIVFYIIMFLVINYFINKSISITPTKFYLIMGIYMLSALFIYPPLQTPDEPVHFARAINLSQQGLKYSQVSDMTVPKNIEALNYSSLGNRDIVKSINDVNESFKNEENITKSVIFGASGKFSRNGLGYAGSAFLLKIVDFFTNSPLIIFLSGRLGNFLLAFFMIFMAIRICPSNKRILLSIATIPMFIQQMVSYSYDSILNASCLLIFAYSLAINKNIVKIDWKLMIKLLLLLAIVASVKIIYLPLAILLLFTSKKQFKNTKSRVLYYIVLIGGTYLLYFLIVNNFFLFDLGSVSTGSVIPNNNQLDYLKSNPLQIFNIAINTIKIKTVWYLQSLIGFFAWFKFKLSNFTIISYLLFLILLVLSEKNEYFNYEKLRDTHIKKIAIIISLIIVIAGIFGAMYLGWSDYMLPYVEGVQGRYFLPLLPLLFLLFIPRQTKFKISDNSIYMFINIVMIQYLVYILTFFY